MAFSDGCFFDPEDGLFKMWYRPSMGSGVAYAVSEDGISWTKPELDIRPRTNIVALSGHRDSSTVWLDHDAADPDERFKLFQFHLRNGELYSFWVSPDGSGASLGYVAAGGPGFAGATDTAGGPER